MAKLKFGLLMIMVFLSGFVANANLSRLIDPNPLYEAAWWKIWYELFLSVMFSSLAWRETRAGQ